MTSDLDLASLLASRLCHDVVGPVGAIQNGLELIAEDDSMAEMAMDLIKKSAAQATAKLQYARMAYGAAGGADVLDPGEAGRLTEGMFSGERATLDWRFAGPPTDRNTVKLAMLMATFALAAVPRGGDITVEHDDTGCISVRASGNPARVPPFTDLMTMGGEATDPRAVQAMLMARLAAASGATIVVEADDSAFVARTTKS
ncbi:MAG: histidine phosphotransferase family protein [Pseudomonadota bacterium]